MCCAVTSFRRVSCIDIHFPRRKCPGSDLTLVVPRFCVVGVFLFVFYFYLFMYLFLPGAAIFAPREKS